ncbi:MAG: Group 3b NADP-coupled cytosolic [NiFe] hydrogenase, large subunit [Ignavibacteriae bacterium]|nr:MAG: Group 3b NADP-coupled cytosolic [NiFe] hydrogenase, large subunit [Ignavibacteriota bacterium]
MDKDRKIVVPHLGRVEGHGGIDVEIEKGDISKVNMEIFEGSRFYEVLIIGKKYSEISSIVSRVCGICSAGHTLTSQMATENAFQIKITQRTEFLRGLLLHGEAIESHALHLGCLVLPDLLGYDGPLSMAKDYPKEVTIALNLKKLGNKIQELIGGRAIHPINAVVGGFGKCPSKTQLEQLKIELQKGLEMSDAIVDLFSKIKLPDFNFKEGIYSALLPKEERYSYLGDYIYTSDGITRPISEFRKVCHEKVVAHSTAKQSLYNNQPFMVGALARININHKYLTGKAKEALDKLFPILPSHNPLHINYAQAVELVHSIERSIQLIKFLFEIGFEHEEPVQFEVFASKGVGAIEVPRGTLYHYYEFNDKGEVVEADIITPTAQNLANVEKNMREAVKTLMQGPLNTLQSSLENIARAYDPCISCATHLVRIKFK